MSKKVLLSLIGFALVLFFLSRDYGDKEPPRYGVSFSRFHADELGLDWRATFLALVRDLGVRDFRFSAHWPLTEPADDHFNFTELDFQMAEARRVGASVILAVGRRLPGWPECHVPAWAEKLTPEQQQEELLGYIKAMVRRYKDFSNLLYWQVENEPYLTLFGRQACGKEVDEGLLEREIALVRELDPAHPVLLTDGGEFGTWLGAYRRADVFGTTMYLYIWSPTFGKFRYPITPGFFRAKSNLVSLLTGVRKPSLVIELAAEPWLLHPIIETPFDVQFERMGLDKFEEILIFSRKTGFDMFYVWGAEWWYWLKLHGYPQHWERALTLFHSL